jgi:hypothetical protein
MSRGKIHSDSSPDVTLYAMGSKELSGASGKYGIQGGTDIIGYTGG